MLTVPVRKVTKHSKIITCRLLLRSKHKIIHKYALNCFFIAQQSLLGQGLLIIEVSRSHSDTQHSLGLLWTRDQPEAETPHTILTADRHPWPRQDSDPQSRQANDRKHPNPPNATGIGIPHSKQAASLLQRVGSLFRKLNAIYSENNKRPISVGEMQSWWFT